jgi:uncharacterized protein YegL
MTDKNLTYIGIILDRSGSMSGIKKDMEGGFKSFLKTQKEESGRALVSLFQFDDRFETVYKNVDIRDIDELILIPRGSTALLDAIGRASGIIGEDLRSRPENERPGNVIIYVITDGQENSSREYSAGAIRKIISDQTNKYAWNFQFLGANQDAVTTGVNLGFSADTSMTFGTNSSSVHNTWRNLGASASRGREATRSGLSPVAVAASYGYSAKERSSSNIGDVDDSDETE